jgi:hypothetical protein
MGVGGFVDREPVSDRVSELHLAQKSKTLNLELARERVKVGQGVSHQAVAVD